MSTLNPTATVTIFVRHSEECEKENGKLARDHKKCGCRKWLYIYEGGKGRRVTANTRSWKEAERVAQVERVRLDPIEIAKKRLSGEVATTSEDTVAGALKQWTLGFKNQTHSTSKSYRSFVTKVTNWAEANGIKRLVDVTPDHLDKWRSEWGTDAPAKGNRLNLTSQNQLQGRLRAFFEWAVEIRKIPWNPALILSPIPNDPEKTQPLTPEQFEELLQATYVYDESCRRECDRFGAELRALFLMQRWVGLRVIDALLLPHKALVKGVLTLQTMKTDALVETKLPSRALAALRELRPRRGTSPAHYFWSGSCTVPALRATWLKRIRRLNKHLNFKDEEGQPMRFHSHMLRDTFAVELLLIGVPLEEVSRLLTHKSVKVTEKHYSPWIKRRQQQLREHHVDYMVRMGATFDADV